MLRDGLSYLIRGASAETIHNIPIEYPLHQNRAIEEAVYNSLYIYPAGFFNINSDFSRFPALQQAVLRGDSRGRHYRFL